MTQSKRPPSVVSLMIIVGGLAGVTPFAGAARAACTNAAITCNGSPRKTGDGDSAKPLGKGAHKPGNQALVPSNAAQAGAADAPAAAKGQKAGFFCNMRPAANAPAGAKGSEKAGFFCNMSPAAGKSAANNAGGASGGN